MKKLALIGALILVVWLATPGYGQQYNRADRVQIAGGFMMGYYGGAGGRASATFTNIAAGLPVSARLAMGYAGVSPGDAADARRIFINDATNGVPSKRGWRWDFALDVIWPWRGSDTRTSYLFAGPRYVKHTSNFKYTGGNEDFDVKSTHWGVGAGWETHFNVNPRFDLIFGAGLDYYLQSTLYGHDTSYSHDGKAVNQRRDYTFDDADDAIRQPRFEPRLMVGINYRLR